MDEAKCLDQETSNEFNSTLNRKKLTKRLIDGLTGPLDHHFEKLVPAQPWIVYWITHSLSLLDQQQFLKTVTEGVIEFIGECSHRDGGYGGGFGQIAHLGTTFAAVNAIITTTSEDALESIDRTSLVRFLHRMKQPDGSFSMHDEGEVDSRATYCALSILRSLNIQDSILIEGAADWVLDCQTYEGGFGSVPGSEAHGGYTFCCVASLCLLNQLHRANIDALLRWLVNKQTSNHGGFCGRSNKLVDSCYSYWQGAVFPLIYPLLKKQFVAFTRTPSSEDESEEKDDLNTRSAARLTQERPQTRSSTRKHREDDSNRDKELALDDLFASWLMDCAALQDYILNQCQSKYGLLKDKPGAEPDFYHTCYALSGLSISQHLPSDSLFDIGSHHLNSLAPTHPLFNLTLPSLDLCFEYFQNKKIETFDRERLDKEHENVDPTLIAGQSRTK